MCSRSHQVQVGNPSSLLKQKSPRCGKCNRQPRQDPIERQLGSWRAKGANLTCIRGRPALKLVAYTIPGNMERRVIRSRAYPLLALLLHDGIRPQTKLACGRLRRRVLSLAERKVNEADFRCPRPPRRNYNRRGSKYKSQGEETTKNHNSPNRSVGGGHHLEFGGRAGRLLRR